MVQWPKWSATSNGTAEWLQGDKTSNHYHNRLIIFTGLQNVSCVKKKSTFRHFPLWKSGFFTLCIFRHPYIVMIICVLLTCFAGLGLFAFRFLYKTSIYLSLEYNSVNGSLKCKKMISKDIFFCWFQQLITTVWNHFLKSFQGGNRDDGTMGSKGFDFKMLLLKWWSLCCQNIDNSNVLKISTTTNVMI